MVLLICLVLFLAMTGHSSAASYCLCKDGVSDQALQKTLDYACGAGADCSAILQNGACYNPNTVKDHCNYAVNSYFQRKGPNAQNCDFSGTATISSNPPSNVPSTCSYPTSATSTAPTTGGTAPTTGGTTPTTGGTTTPTGTPSTIPNTGTTTGSPTVFGGGSTLGPGTATGINDPSHAASLFKTTNNFFFTLAIMTLWVVGLSLF